MGPVRVVVMGVASSGKSTIGARLAHELGATFVDGDALHPERNVAMMSAGTPLTDEDRLPWLERVRDSLAAADAIVIACSALKRSYRDLIRQAGAVEFVHLDLDEATAVRRAAERAGHFMGSEMVAGQFATLEPPGADEHDVITVDADLEPSAIVGQLVDRLGS